MGSLKNNFTSLVQNYSYGNSTNGTFTRNEDLARVEVIVQSVIFVFAVLGNTMVLLSLYRKRKSLTRMHHLMIHLSLADLFVAFGSVLPQLAWDITFVFKGGDLLCRLVKYMQIVAIYASAYVLVMTAIDRYFAICLPLISHKWSNKMVRKMVLVAWSLSLLLSVPQLFIFSYQLNAYGNYDCWGTFEPMWTLTVYITTFTVLVYIIPTLILIFCYGSICIVVWRSGRVGERLGAPPKSANLSAKENRGASEFGSIELQTHCGNGGPKEHLCNAYSQSDIYDTHGNSNHRKLTLLQKTDKGGLSLNGTTRVKYSFVKNAPKTVICTCNSEPRHCQISRSSSCTLNGNNASDKLIPYTGDTVRSSSFSTNSKQGKTFKHSPMGSPGKLTPTSGIDGTHSSLSINCTPRRMLLHTPKGSPNTITARRGAGHGISKAKMKTIKLTLTVVICYLACWSPFFVAQMWAVYDPTAPFNGAPYTIILLLASLNSCTNPWIYLIFSESFMSEFKQTSIKLTNAIRCRTS